MAVTAVEVVEGEGLFENNPWRRTLVGSSGPKGSFLKHRRQVSKDLRIARKVKFLHATTLDVEDGTGIKTFGGECAPRF